MHDACNCHQQARTQASLEPAPPSPVARQFAPRTAQALQGPSASGNKSSKTVQLSASNPKVTTSCTSQRANSLNRHSEPHAQHLTLLTLWRCSTTLPLVPTLSSAAADSPAMWAAPTKPFSYSPHIISRFTLEPATTSSPPPAHSAECVSYALTSLDTHVTPLVISWACICTLGHHSSSQRASYCFCAMQARMRSCLLDSLPSKISHQARIAILVLSCTTDVPA